MALLPGYEYDIFISYRHNDNRSGWVTEFVHALQEELAATIKEPLSIYFDKNPHDGLLDTHSVDKSLEGKLKCLIFIPIISQTYCDTKSFAWQHEFVAFNKLSKEDRFGQHVQLSSKNVSSRILPIRIHDLMASDKATIEAELGGPLRAIDFIYKEPGVNRPLKLSDDRNTNLNKTDYRNQVNKTAHAINDLMAALQGKETTSTSILTNSTPGDSTQRPRANRPKVNKQVILSLLLFISLFVVGALYVSMPSPEAVTYRTSILPPEETRINMSLGGNIALSPNGEWLTYVATDSQGNSALWVRPLNSLQSRQLNGTEGAFLPFWSPNNQSIGFFANGKLKKIDITGGAPQTLCDVSFGRGGTWNQDGLIIFNALANGPLYVVSETGGKVTTLTKLDTAHREVSHRWPYFLPDGQHFLYTSRVSQTGLNKEDAIFLASLDTTVAPRLLFSASSSMAYANGHILFAHQQTLMAQPFDAKSLHISGDAFPLVENVYFESISSRSCFSASQNGNLIYQAGLNQSTTHLGWRHRAGEEIDNITQQGKVYLHMRLSPDGERIAICQPDANNENDDVWIYEIKRDLWTRFTFDAATDRSPIWSPDGKTVLFASDRIKNLDLFQRASSGANDEELLLQTNQSKIPTDWSRDGKYITYFTLDKYDIWILPMTASGPGKPFVFLESEFDERRAVFSPDGRWIAYQSDESGRNEVYIRPFPGPGGKWQVSATGGTRPHWRKDGKELFFMGTDFRLMSAQINAGMNAVQVGSVQPLFDHSAFAIGTVSRDIYDVSDDGQRFLLEWMRGNEASIPITLVVNWPGELRKNN